MRLILSWENSGKSPWKGVTFDMDLKKCKSLLYTEIRKKPNWEVEYKQ